MIGRASVVALGIGLVASVAVAYEWNAHKGMALNARDIFLGSASTHKPPYPVDQELLDFLRVYGEAELDTRAGNTEKDEDHCEGVLTWGPLCTYREVGCLFYCTFDHFSPKLSWPLANSVLRVHLLNQGADVRYVLWPTLIVAGEHLEGEQVAPPGDRNDQRIEDPHRLSSADQHVLDA